jgi:hypothetical protein
MANMKNVNTETEIGKKVGIELYIKAVKEAEFYILSIFYAKIVHYDLVNSSNFN